MPAKKTPKEIFDELCEAQGRRHIWVAQQAGMSKSTLWHKFMGDGTYRWLEGEREAIANALGVPVHFIWPDMGEDDAAALGDGGSAA